MKHKTKKKDTGLTVILIVLVAITGLILAAKLMGIKMYAVTSPSMKPTYNVYDVVIIKKTDFDDIKAGETDGDVITFFIRDNQTATHRVISKNDISKTFQTKGDNNETADGTRVRYENVVGKVLFSIPQLGRITSLFSDLKGRIILIAIIVVLTIAFLLWNGDSKKEVKDENTGKQISAMNSDAENSEDSSESDKQ